MLNSLGWFLVAYFVGLVQRLFPIFLRDVPLFGVEKIRQQKSLKGGKWGRQANTEGV